MTNLIPFYRAEDERKKYAFINKPVIIKRKEDVVKFPCIGLYRREAVDVPVWYPLYERWYVPCEKTQSLANATLRKRSTAICEFLNYILWKTNHSYLHEINLKDINKFTTYYKNKKDGQERSASGWNEGIAFVYEFLVSYHIHNRNNFEFAYSPERLISERIILDEHTRRMHVVKDYLCSSKVKKQPPKKNRILLYGYLNFILFECEMYDPELTFPIALQAYAGLREGEVVNLVWKSIQMRDAGFGTIGDITMDILKPAPHARKDQIVDFGDIKNTRKQKVYPKFNEEINKLYNAHMARHQAMGYSVAADAPVLLNKWGRPMRVKTYTDRVKKLFYDHFLPDLKKVSVQNGSWDKDRDYIEIYERDYPGAHAFRHWFTMFLFQRENLRSEEVSKWRGDESSDSMLAYIHLNADMIESFKQATHTFQRKLLEEIL